MDVKKIFILLITVVACVIIGALVLNVLLPNGTTAIIDATEQQLANGTGMSFDFNGNGQAGEAGTGNQDYSDSEGKIADSDGAEGIDGGDTVSGRGVAP